MKQLTKRLRSLVLRVCAQLWGIEKRYGNKNKCQDKVGEWEINKGKRRKKRVVYIAIKEDKVFQCPIDKKVVFLVFFGPYWTHHCC